MSERYSKNWCQGFCRTCGTGCGEHEEAKYQLMKERDALKAEVERLKNHNEVQVGLAKLYQKQRNDERERSEKLREALEYIANSHDWGKDTALRRSISDLQDCARQALAGDLGDAKQDEGKE